MSSLSVKPDKCAILQETVNQIRIRQESTTRSSDPVQQGEVSSSAPPGFFPNDSYGPLLLDALDGFLFVVNAEGKIEHVTGNVSSYITFTKEEIIGNSIYNFIHHGDHARFSSSLLPMSIGWSSEPSNRSRSFSCRLLVKSNNLEGSIEEKQQHISRYEPMHISSTQLRNQLMSDEDSGDSAFGLLCIASRISHRDSIPALSVDQFTTKLDITGKVIAVDSTVSSSLSQDLKKDLMGRNLQEVYISEDSEKFGAHLAETLTKGQATSGLYKLRLISSDKVIHVKTKSKYFKTNSSSDTDFIMSTHSIVA